MPKKYLAPLVILVLVGAAALTLSYKPCLVSGPFCEAHLKKTGAQKDKDTPYYLSFTTAWLAKPANILYPAYAMERGITGVAKLELRVDGDGKLIEKSLSESSGHRILDEAALAAADTFVFDVAGFGQVLFPYSKELKIRFQLDDGPG